MKICVYTSCSINYLPKARALSRSLKKHHPDAHLILLLNDVIPPWLDLKAEPFDDIWLSSDLGYSPAWIFKHNVMEICTGVKGRAISKILAEVDADLYAYFDPDVYVYNNLSPLLDYMGDAQIGLVPHITKPETTEVGVLMTEMSAAAHGTYNLGHLILRKGDDSNAFAAWWGARLDEFCYDDKDYGLFTDQRWCDLAPALFDNVRILRQPNIDVASWNVYGRTILQHVPGDASSFTVNDYPLLTYHFSGTGPTGTHKRVREIFVPSNPAVAEIERLYETELAELGQAELEKWPYGGDFFDNGVRVTQEMRRLYRKNRDLEDAFPNPYAVDANTSFLAWIRQNRPELGSGIILSSSQFEIAFNAIFDHNFYLQKYPEANTSIKSGLYVNALDHYIAIGSKLLYDPSPYFDSHLYFERAQKIEGSGLRQLSKPIKEHTLLGHYLKFGLTNEIEPVRKFSSNCYLKYYPDIAAAVRSGAVPCPLVHFIAFGDAESRRPSEEFDPSVFLQNTAQARALIESGGARGAFEAAKQLGMLD